MIIHSEYLQGGGRGLFQGPKLLAEPEKKQKIIPGLTEIRIRCLHDLETIAYSI